MPSKVDLRVAKASHTGILALTEVFKPHHSEQKHTEQQKQAFGVLLIIDVTTFTRRIRGGK